MHWKSLVGICLNLCFVSLIVAQGDDTPPSVGPLPGAWDEVEFEYGFIGSDDRRVVSRYRMKETMTDPDSGADDETVESEFKEEHLTWMEVVRGGVVSEPFAISGSMEVYRSLTVYVPKPGGGRMVSSWKDTWTSYEYDLGWHETERYLEEFSADGSYKMIYEFRDNPYGWFKEGEEFIAGASGGGLMWVYTVEQDDDGRYVQKEEFYAVEESSPEDEEDGDGEESPTEEEEAGDGELESNTPEPSYEESEV